MLNMRIPDKFLVIFCVGTFEIFCMELTRYANKVDGRISCQYLDTVYERE
jgi:hypothetical protein